MEFRDPAGEDGERARVKRGPRLLEDVREIRARSRTVPLAIVSGWADAISVDVRNSVKADWVIAKPFDIDKISGIAQQIVERKVG